MGTSASRHRLRRASVVAACGLLPATILTGCLTPPDRSDEHNAIVAELREQPGVTRVIETYVNDFTQGRFQEIWVTAPDASAEQLGVLADIIVDGSGRVFDDYRRTYRFDFSRTGDKNTRQITVNDVLDPGLVRADAEVTEQVIEATGDPAAKVHWERAHPYGPRLSIRTTDPERAAAVVAAATEGQNVTVTVNHTEAG